MQVSDLEKSTHKMDVIHHVIDPSTAVTQQLTHDLVSRFAFGSESRESSPQREVKFMTRGRRSEPSDETVRRIIV